LYQVYIFNMCVIMLQSFTDMHWVLWRNLIVQNRCNVSGYTIIYLCPIICEGWQLYVKVDNYMWRLTIICEGWHFTQSCLETICQTIHHFCSTSGTRRVNLVTNPVISCEWGKDREVFTTSGIYPWSFVTRIVLIKCSKKHIHN
jgi:hypothetical protein